VGIHGSISRFRFGGDHADGTRKAHRLRRASRATLAVAQLRGSVFWYAGFVVMPTVASLVRGIRGDAHGRQGRLAHAERAHVDLVHASGEVRRDGGVGVAAAVVVAEHATVGEAHRERAVVCSARQDAQARDRGGGGEGDVGRRGEPAVAVGVTRRHAGARHRAARIRVDDVGVGDEARADGHGLRCDRGRSDDRRGDSGGGDDGRDRGDGRGAAHAAAGRSQEGEPEDTSADDAAELGSEELRGEREMKRARHDRVSL
jgi:hypothetical protein